MSAQFEQVGGYDFYRSCFPTMSCKGLSTMTSLIRVRCISIRAKDERLIDVRCTTIVMAAGPYGVCGAKSFDTVLVLFIAGITAGARTADECPYL